MAIHGSLVRGPAGESCRRGRTLPPETAARHAIPPDQRPRPAPARAGTRCASADGDPIRVGVLSLHSSKETKAILDAVDDLGHEGVWLRRENTAVSVRGGDVAIEPGVDVVANRLLLSKSEAPVELLGLATTFGRIRPMLVLLAVTS